MTKRKLKSNNIQMEDLVRQCLSMPREPGWFEEVYVNPKTHVVSFSSPLTGNTWTDDPDKVGTIDSMTIGDFDGLYERDDGQIEIDIDSNIAGDDMENWSDDEPQKGEFYDEVLLLTRDGAIERISDYLEEPNFGGSKSELAELLDLIKYGKQDDEQ